MTVPGSSLVTDAQGQTQFVPEMLRLARWRNLPPLAWPSRTPFNADSCKELLLRKHPRNVFQHDWQQLNLSLGMTSEEAHYWIEAAGLWCHANHSRFVSRMTGFRPTGKLELSACAKLFENRHRDLPTETVIPLVALFGPEQILRALLDGSLTQTVQYNYWTPRYDLALIQGFWLHVVPYLDLDEHKALRSELESRLDPREFPTTYQQTIPRSFAVAAILDCHDILDAVVKNWQPPNAGMIHYVVHHLSPLIILFGLRDPRRIEQVVRSFGFRLANRFDVRFWLAHTELGALDYLLSRGNRNHVQTETAIYQELMSIQHPQIAPIMLQLLLEGINPRSARRWLELNVGSTVAGLLEVAAGRDKTAEAAANILRDTAKRGDQWVIDRELEILAEKNEGLAARVRRVLAARPERVVDPMPPELEPDWLAAIPLQSATRVALPDFLDPRTLPPVLVEGFRLSDDRMGQLLAEIVSLPPLKPNEPELFLDERFPLLIQLRVHAETDSLDSLARAMFVRWMAEKASTVNLWVMTALALLGKDAAAAELAQKLRRWPGGSSIKRFREGAMVLRFINTPYSTSLLAQLMHTASSSRNRSNARVEFEKLANARGVSVEHLEETAIPDLELQSGGAQFDYGPRQFRATLAADLRLMLIDDLGKRHASLPTPRASDDRAAVAIARENWKLAKKQCQELIGQLVKRLEGHLVAERRWLLNDFRSGLASHPVAGAVVRRLIWGWFDAQDQLLGSFRISEESEFVGPDDRPAPVLASKLGLVHPALLSDDQLHEWQHRLAEYEIAQPFPQLARPIYPLLEGERKQTLLKRFLPPSVPHKAISFNRWSRIHDMLLATFPIQGIYVGLEVSGWGPIQIHRCRFYRAPEGNAGFRPNPQKPDSMLELGQVPKVVLNEALAEINGWAL